MEKITSICPLCQKLLVPDPELRVPQCYPEYYAQVERMKWRVFWASIFYFILLFSSGFLAGYLIWGIHS